MTIPRLTASLPDRRSRRWWRRLERKALVGHRKDQLHDLAELAARSTEIHHLVGDSELSGTSCLIGGSVIGLRTPGRLLVLAGVGSQARVEVAGLLAVLPVRIIDAGRYAGIWWITLSDGVDHTLITASHLRLLHVNDDRTPAVL